ncbi:glycosyltransferase, partial [Gammaproteobacteria bacterium AB-CW1]|nr:glycosyltransferase [Gammaproteobacteria bacterium AB-CW1]
ARRAAAMITTTDMRADHFVEAYGVGRPVVVQNRPFYRAAPRSNRLREALGLDASVPVFLYQGGLQAGRGLESIIDAAAGVAGVHFAFLGPGILRDDLMARARERGVIERVHFLEAVPFEELPAWTASADVGLQLLENIGLNHYSTDSNKIFEYGMAGLPVIASDFPEIRKIVESADFGLLVDPADIEAIRAAMIRLRDDAGLRRRFAENALRQGRALSFDTEAPKLLGVYERIGQ